MRISGRLREVTSSYTLSLRSEAEKLRKADASIIDLGSGEPDFATPDNIKEAARRAIDEGRTRMGGPYGLADLRNAVVQSYERSCGTDYRENEVIITSGAKNALFSCALSLFNEGDEVVLFSPSWISYAEQVRIAGAKPVFIRTEQDNRFQPDIGKLESVLKPATKAVILNNPANPSGVIISVEELKKIAILSLQKDFYIICDECLDHFIYEEGYGSMARFAKKIRDRLIIVNAVSETYAMSGWRVGYALGPKNVIDAMAKVISHDCSQPSSVSQRAALEAMTGPQDFIKQVIAEYRKKRDTMFELIWKIKELSCLRPDGTFYMFPDVTALLERLKLESTTEFSNHLLKHARVITIPGEIFNYPGHVRFSFAPPLEAIVEGMRRVEDCLRQAM